jgi:hypothetical protein
MEKTDTIACSSSSKADLGCYGKCERETLHILRSDGWYRCFVCGTPNRLYLNYVGDDVDVKRKLREEYRVNQLRKQKEQIAIKKRELNVLEQELKDMLKERT